MDQEESAPADQPGNPLSKETLSALAMLRAQEAIPPALWDALGAEARRKWLHVALQPQGWSAQAWESIPRSVQRELRLKMRQIFSLFASIGYDLVVK